MITPAVVSLILLLFLAVLVSYLDIRYRTINIPYLLFFCGIVGFFASVSVYGLAAVGMALIPAGVIILIVTSACREEKAELLAEETEMFMRLFV